MKRNNSFPTSWYGRISGYSGWVACSRIYAFIDLFKKTAVQFYLNGGGERDRTVYLLHAMQALYQLSYTPIPEDASLRDAA